MICRYHRQRDLASILAIAPETLCRIMAKFKRRGWIASTAEGVTVRDPASLGNLIA